MKLYPSKEMRLLIIAGCFALACCLILTLGKRYECHEGKVTDNWTGKIYHYDRTEIGNIGIYFSPNKNGR